MVSAWFISDIHIKDINERSGQTLLRFLLSLEKNERPATHLFLLGDIFDLWVGNHSFFGKKFAPIVDSLARLAKKGVEVHYVEGNHDVHVIPFWKNRGVDCWVDPRYMRLGNTLFRLEHGDLINPNDEKYLKYREFIRRPYMEKLAHILPGRLLGYAGDRASKKSRKQSSHYRASQEDKLREMIRVYAEKAYGEGPYEILITGHMHLVDDFKFEKDGKTARSINLGSWFEGPKALNFTGTEFQWHDLV